MGRRHDRNLQGSLHLLLELCHVLITSLSQILPFLHSKSFETRTAATSALSHICQMTPAWTPQTSPAASLTASPPTPAPEFPTFDVAQMLKTGTLLLASSGKEYELSSFSSSNDVARAQKEVMSRLGLGFMDGVGGDTDMDLDLGKELTLTPQPMDLDSDETKAPPHHPLSPSPADGGDTSSASSPAGGTIDLHPIPAPSKSIKRERVKSEAAEDNMSVDIPSDGGAGLSARERNRLKRKLKTGNSAFVAPSPTTARPSFAAGSSNKCAVPLFVDLSSSNNQVS